MANSCALARERLAKKVASLRDATPLEKGVKLIKTGFLGSVVTPMKALGGNAIATSYRVLAEHPVRAAVDYIHAVGKSAADGKFTLSPDAYRQVVFSLDREGLGTLARGFKRGAEPTIEAVKAASEAASQAPGVWGKVRQAVITFGDELNLRLDAEKVNRTLEYQETKYANPVTDAVVNSVMGVMEAVDRPYWRAAHDFSLYMQSKVMAGAEGLKGPALQERAARLFERPTDEMTFRAVTDANYTTFKNRNWLARMAGRVKGGAQQMAEKAPTAPKGTARYGVEKTAQSGAKVGSYALETNLPFTGVPSSIAGQSFGLSSGPAGLVRLLTNHDPAAVSRIVSDAALGSTLIAMGYQLAKDGRITGAAPSSSKERAQFDAEGRQAWSVNIGGKWFDLRFAVPIAAPLYAGAALATLKANDPTASSTDKVMAAVGGTAKMLTQQTYLQNVRNVIDAMGAPTEKGARFVASQVPVPALSGQIARASDPIERRPEGIAGMLAAKVPGLSRLNPPSVDALGRTQRRTPLERASELLSPSRIKESTETPVTQEFARLGISLSLPGKQSTVKGRTFARKGQTQADYLTTVGQAVDAYLTQYIRSPAYQKMPDDEKALALEKVQDVLHRNYSKQAAAKSFLSGRQPDKLSPRVRRSLFPSSPRD
jgi:hypothetical protein